METLRRELQSLVIDLYSDVVLNFAVQLKCRLQSEYRCIQRYGLTIQLQNEEKKLILEKNR